MRPIMLPPTPMAAADSGELAPTLCPAIERSEGACDGLYVELVCSMWHLGFIQACVGASHSRCHGPPRPASACVIKSRSQFDTLRESCSSLQGLAESLKPRLGEAVHRMTQSAALHRLHDRCYLRTVCYELVATQYVQRSARKRLWRAARSADVACEDGASRVQIRVSTEFHQLSRLRNTLHDRRDNDRAVAATGRPSPCLQFCRLVFKVSTSVNGLALHPQFPASPIHMQLNMQVADVSCLLQHISSFACLLYVLPADAYMRQSGVAQQGAMKPPDIPCLITSPLHMVFSSVYSCVAFCRL